MYWFDSCVFLLLGRQLLVYIACLHLHCLFTEVAAAAGSAPAPATAPGIGPPPRPAGAFWCGGPRGLRPIAPQGLVLAAPAPAAPAPSNLYMVFPLYETSLYGL